MEMEKKNNYAKTYKLTDHFTYSIDRDTIYLFQSVVNVNSSEFDIVFKKLALLIEDYDLSYINISARKIEDRKKLYQDLGFTLSFYDVNKLNSLYRNKKNKSDYKCYGLMTKSDFFNNMNKDKIEKKNNDVVVKSSNSGYISNLLLLSFSIIFLCYLCVRGAMLLVK